MTKEKGRIGFWDYVIPGSKMTDVERAVDFILWAARVMPNRPVPLEQIVRVALNLPKLPREEAQTIKQFKSRLAVVKRILLDQYQKALLYHPGAGYRCTVNSEDAAQTYQEITARGVASAVRRFSKARAIIKRNELKPTTAERFDTLGNIEKKLTADSLYGKLLESNISETDKKDK
jgi:hypothetical protein